LGVWERFRADGHEPAPSIASAWGGSALVDNDFITNPFGPGWHIDRCRFDAMMAQAAEAAGVEVQRAARWNAWTHDPDSPPGRQPLDAVLDSGALRIRHAFRVDATGRGAAFVRRLGVPRQHCDRLVGILGVVTPRAGAGSADRRTLVEAVEDGWWYTARLPEGRHIAAFMTDADLLPRHREPLATYWQDRLRRAPHTNAWLGSAVVESRLRTVAASTSFLETMAGRDWLAVGDAAAAFDPLSGQGVFWALTSGLKAARVIERRLRGELRNAISFERWVRRHLGDYMTARAVYYGREGRWPDSPFWLRRRSPRSGSRKPARRHRKSREFTAPRDEASVLLIHTDN
jgi:flavin-dependent dehydrogenase